MDAILLMRFPFSKKNQVILSHPVSESLFLFLKHKKTFQEYIRITA